MPSFREKGGRKPLRPRSPTKKKGGDQLIYPAIDFLCGIDEGKRAVEYRWP